VKPHERQLRDALEESHRQGARLDEPGFPEQELQLLQDWQRTRLAETYADLLEQPQYQAAGHFFLEELYGGLDFRARDREVEHVLPVMTRMLPDHMLLSMADAFELQALSMDLDIAMAQEIRVQRLQKIDILSYGDVYQCTNREADRVHQVELIYRLGLELNELVRHHMVLKLVRLLRFPARAAGFGKLQGFLEEGLYAFRAMRDGKAFVEAISAREKDFMLHLQSGSTEPFRNFKTPG
jgi:hypothetical protein